MTDRQAAGRRYGGWEVVQDPPPGQPDPRRPDPGAQMSKVAKGAELAGKATTSLEHGAKLAQALYPTTTSTRTDLPPKVLGKAVGLTERYVKPLSTALDVATAQAGYMADVRRGMAPDEALVKHYGKFAAKALGASMGGALGASAGMSIGGPVGGAMGGGIGALGGATVGEAAGDGFFSLYKKGKGAAKMTTAEAQQLLRSIQVMSTDRYFIDQAAARLRLTGRGY